MKICRLLALVICFLPSWIAAQNRAALDFQFGAHQSGLIVKNPTLQGEYIENLGYSAGLHFNYRIGDKTWLRSGVRYSVLGYKTPKKVLRWGTDFDPVTGLPREDSIQILSQFIYNHRYFEIPILGHFNFTASKLAVYTEFGFSSNFYLNTEDVYKKGSAVESRSIQKDLVANPLHFAVLGALGINYQLGNQNSLFFQTNIRRGISPGNDGKRSSSYWYSYRLDLGTRFLLD